MLITKLIPVLVAGLTYVGFSIPLSAQPCSTNKPAPPGMICQTLVSQIVGGLSRAAFSVGQAIGEEAKIIDGRVSAARTLLQQTPLGSSNYSDAATDFAATLQLKDLWYLSIDLLPVPISPYPDYLDGGIRREALGNFDLWSDWVKRTSGRTITNVAGASSLLSGPASVTLPAYDYYRLNRDWIEYSAIGQLVSNDPEQVVRYIIAMDRTWDRRSPHTDAEWRTHADAYFAQLVEVFGKAAIVSAGKQIIQAPKNSQGLMQPAIRIDGVECSAPYLSLMALLGSGGSREYTVLLSSRPLGILNRKQTTGRPTRGPSLLAAAPDLANAAATYKRWMDSYGEKRTLAVAQLIRSAEKDSTGALANPAVLGTTERQPRLALEDILRRSIGIAPLSAAPSTTRTGDVPAASPDSPPIAAERRLPVQPSRNAASVHHWYCSTEMSQPTIYFSAAFDAEDGTAASNAFGEYLRLKFGYQKIAGPSCFGNYSDLAAVLKDEQERVSGMRTEPKWKIVETGWVPNAR